jgi:ABC-2 type transport system permease protein
MVKLIEKKTLWLLRKEVKSVFRSRWLLLGFMISPLFAWLFESAFLTFIVAQTTEEEETVYITPEDDGAWGQFLYNAIKTQVELEKDPNATKILRINELKVVDKESGQELWDNRTAQLWVWIPANFTEVLESTNSSTLIITVNTANYRAYAAASRVTNFAISVIRLIITIRDLRVKWIFPVTPEATFGHQLAIFLVMITSVLAPSPYISKSFAGERENHTLEALLVVPMSRLKILASKLVAGVLLTMIYSLFTIIGILLYDWSIVLRAASLPASDAQYYIDLYSINIGTLPLIFFCQFMILLTAIGIGVVISMAAKDQATAESINNLILLVPTTVIGMLAFTGSITQYGGIFGAFVLVIPFTHAIIFLNGVLSGVATPISLLGNILYMLVFTIVFLIIGAKLFEREAIIA